MNYLLTVTFDDILIVAIYGNRDRLSEYMGKQLFGGDHDYYNTCMCFMGEGRGDPIGTAQGKS